MGLAARLFRGVCPVPCPSPHLPAAQSHEKAFRSHGSFAGAALQGPTLGHRPGGLCPAPRPGPARELTASSPRVLPRALACVLAEMILMLPMGWHHEHVLTGKTAVALRTQAPPTPRVHTSCLPPPVLQPRQVGSLPLCVLGCSGH